MNLNHAKMAALVFGTVLIAILATSGHALGMGANPSTCDNRYDGQITSMIITNGDQTYDPIANPGITFDVENDKSYTVALVIHTPDQSVNGNSLDGTTWYHTSAPGYWMGYCVDGAGPNQDIRLELSQEHSGSIAPETTQAVSWATFGSEDIAYNVRWTHPSNSSSVADAPINLVASTGHAKIRLSWNAPGNNGGSPITGYRIDRSTDGTSWSTLVNNTGSTTTRHSDSNIAQNQAYSYRVAAINSVGTGNYSNIAHVGATQQDHVAKMTVNIPGIGIREVHINLNH